MQLGSLSAKYESNGNPGCVSTGYGDAGGVSYGAYQFASSVGVAQAFVSWLSRHGYKYHHILANAGQAGSREFSAAWMWVAEQDYDGFLTMQHEYVKEKYYDPAVRALRNSGYNIENHHTVMQDVVWSRAVQYGVGYIVEMFEEAVKKIGYPNLSYVDAKNFDADMIKAVYAVCATPEWTSGSPSLRQGLYARFENECRDALARLT